MRRLFIMRGTQHYPSVATRCPGFMHVDSHGCPFFLPRPLRGWAQDMGKVWLWSGWNCHQCIFGPLYCIFVSFFPCYVWDFLRVSTSHKKIIWLKNLILENFSKRFLVVLGILWKKNLTGLFLFFFIYLFFTTPCSLWDPQGLNPCPQQWRHGILTTGPPGNSLTSFFNAQSYLIGKGF